VEREKDIVVLVHGLWLVGLEMAVLGRRLRECDYCTVFFHYPSLRCPPQQNADRLQRFVAALQGQRIHFVAHSLGGIVLLHLFKRHSVPPGRVIFLGVPARGSAVARRLAGSRVLRWLIGRSGEQGLLGGAPDWIGARELGVVSGSLGFGLGRLVGGVENPNDGTVAVRETPIPGAAAFLQLPVTHFGLLFSRRVSEACCRFLKQGVLRP